MATQDKSLKEDCKLTFSDVANKSDQIPQLGPLNDIFRNSFSILQFYATFKNLL